ncbi:MAG: TM2 domain-containing protein [Erysipelotrichaceae bacterium]|nr:TM2 domain-containing protein [Erysipelotrichaceae bacterium]
MAKIIGITSDIVSIGTDYNTIEDVRTSDLNFVPHIGDEVEIFKTETKTIVSKVEKKNDFPNGGLNINVNQTQQSNSQSPIYASGKVVNKVVYLVLAFFLGGLGVHKFYAGKIGSGILFVIFSWTFIPAIIAFIEFIIACFKPADANGNIIV